MDALQAGLVVSGLEDGLSHPPTVPRVLSRQEKRP